LLSKENENLRTSKDLNQKRIMFGADETNSILLSMILEKNNIAYRRIPYSFEGFLNNKADAIVAYIGNEPFVLREKGIAYNYLDPASNGLDFYSDILYTSKKEYYEHPRRVNKFMKASMQGWRYAFEHVDETAALIKAKYAPEKSIAALKYEAKVLKKLANLTSKKMGKIDAKKIEQMSKVYQEKGLITSMPDSFDYLHPSAFQTVSLTAAEETWLETHPVIHYGAIDTKPIVAHTNGKVEGIAIDYMNLVAKHCGFKAEYHEYKNRAQLVNAVKNRAVDVSLSMSESMSTEGYADFTKVYGRYPIVIATRNDTDDINDIRELFGKKVAVTENFRLYNYLKANFPEIKLVTLKNTEECLQHLSRAKVYAVVGVLPIVSQGIRDAYLANVKISGTLEYSYELRMMVRSDYTILTSILNKGIASISPADRQVIETRWSVFNRGELTSYQFSRYTNIALIVVLALFIYLYLGIRQRVGHAHRRVKRLEKKLELLEKGISIITLDKFAKIKHVNENYLKVCGYTESELIEKEYHTLLQQDECHDNIESFSRKIIEGKGWSGELAHITKEKKQHWCEVKFIPIPTSSGDIEGYFVTHQDISHLKGVQKMATTDPLTKINNRRYFYEIFEKEISRHKREGLTMGFLMIDIDNFKLYNDLNGHLEGDRVLIEIAKVLQETCQRSSDDIFRLGGEEFGVLVINTDREKTEAFAQKIITAIADLQLPHRGNAPYKVVTSSLGGVVVSLREKEVVLVKDLYAKADRAMYDAKEEGKNRVKIVEA
jgi:diguanylate cyclase (GGDEF)-like protein/PAS domain S-box-containing protein